MQIKLQWLIRSTVMLFIYFLPALLTAETPDSTPTPTIKILTQPNGIYQVGETITYRIQISWPNQADEVRMNPPEVTLRNLKLLGVSQESISKSSTVSKTNQTKDRVLTFRFVAGEPGVAKIEHFELRWTQNDQAISTTIQIPPIQLTITQSSRPIKQLLVGGGFAIVIAASLPLLAIRHYRKKKSIQKPSQSLETQTLTQLQALEQTLSVTSQQQFLEKLVHVFNQYLQEKLDWLPKQGGYNALREKGEEKWSKKEVQQLENLINTLEYQRFSGIPPTKEKLTELYRSVYSFVEQRKVISNEPEDSWKQALKR